MNRRHLWYTAIHQGGTPRCRYMRTAGMCEDSKLKGILFDVHDTLVIKDYRASSRGMLDAAAVVRRAGYDITPDEYMLAIKRASILAREDLEELGEVTVEGWYGMILDNLGIHGYDPEMVGEMNQAFSGAFAKGTRALPYTRGALLKLHKSYRLGIVSNSLAPNTMSDLEVAGIRQFFTRIVISSDAGKRKPHPAIYLSALAGLGLKPDEAVFVGDNPYEDIFGAKKVGMKAVLMSHPLVAEERLHRQMPVSQPREQIIEPDVRISRLDQLPAVLAQWKAKGEEVACLEKSS